MWATWLFSREKRQTCVTRSPSIPPPTQQQDLFNIEKHVSRMAETHITWQVGCLYWPSASSKSHVYQCCSWSFNLLSQCKCCLLKKLCISVFPSLIWIVVGGLGMEWGCGERQEGVFLEGSSLQQQEVWQFQVPVHDLGGGATERVGIPASRYHHNPP